MKYYQNMKLDQLRVLSSTESWDCKSYCPFYAATSGNTYNRDEIGRVAWRIRTHGCKL